MAVVGEASPTFDVCASAKYIAQAFIDQRQLQGLHKTLSSKWGELNSLSAALRLMRAHGVELTPEEEQGLAMLDEGEQIGTLVGKMPTQSNEEFHHFFLKLQLLVSTATRLREALEEGQVDAVAQALEDAEATGVSQHLLRVAIVQAGTQVSSMGQQVKSFGKEAQAKMGSLVRGQQDCVAAQKRLAHATDQLTRKGRSEASKRIPLVMGFAERSERVFLHAVFQVWSRDAQQSAMEARIEEDFKERVQELENRLSAWKMKQFRCTRGMILKQIMEDNAKLVEHVLELWKEGLEESKFERDRAEKIAEFEKVMEGMQASSAELAKKAILRWNDTTDSKILATMMEAWVFFVELSLEEKELKAISKAQQDRSANFGEEQLAKSKKFLLSATAANDQMCKHMCFQTWQEVYTSARQEAELAAILEEKGGELSLFAERSRVNGSCAMARAAQGIRQMDLLRVWGAWRKYTQLEKCMRAYHSRIDAKRQQLHGVQQMFRSFASELDKNYTKETARSMIFDRSARKRGDRTSPKSLEQQGKCVSLPALRDAARPGTGDLQKAKGHRPPLQAR